MLATWACLLLAVAMRPPTRLPQRSPRISMGSSSRKQADLAAIIRKAQALRETGGQSVAAAADWYFTNYKQDRQPERRADDVSWLFS